VLLRTQKLTSFGPIPDFRYQTPVTINLGHVTPFEDGILNSYLTEDKVYYHEWLMLCREIITLYYDNQKIELPKKSSEFIDVTTSGTYSYH
jgi:hypothetical protein